MLSDKWTFSLKILVMLLVVALVASSAMAAEFGATLSVEDVSHAADNQVERGEVVVSVTFGKTVDMSTIAAKVELRTTNEFGGLIANLDADPESGGAQVVAVAHKYPNRADGQNFTLTFPVDATTTVKNDIPYKSALRVAGVPAIAIGDTETSAVADITVYYVDLPVPGEIGGVPNTNPRPVSIGFSNNLLVPADGFTGASFDIIVTLSEEPKGGQFTKDHLDVDKGTASDSVYLGSMDPPEGQTATGRSFRYHRFLFTITPKVEDGALVIKIKSFEDQEKPTPNKYNPPTSDFGGTEGVDILTVKIGKRVLEDVIVVIELSVPKDTVIPGVGPLTPTQNGGADNTEASAKAIGEAVTTTAAAVDTSVMIPGEGEIYISEIMFAGGGFLPQWIEISNGSRTEQVNLSGWTLTVENATAGADVFVSAKAKFRIPEGTRIDPSGQHDTPSTLLVVTKQGRTNLDGRLAAGQVVNLDITRHRYALLSDMAFKITLSPPTTPIVPEQAAARAAATDVVGNLGVDGTATWALPMNESGGRSSIIRRHVPVSMGPAEPKDGEMLESWVLASDSSLAEPMRLSGHSYYGFPTDVGTPGFRAGGALPVELSHFRPERNKETGAVVITWSTQSELNNAGFFIKRRQQRDGEFQVINTTMVAGAGTSSEKQFYTYTDTTAQRSVVYYYQIEDVSLDGDRQTLTRGIRLKGHIGAAGKLTMLWGELKTQE